MKITIWVMTSPEGRGLSRQESDQSKWKKTVLRAKNGHQKILRHY